MKRVRTGVDTQALASAVSKPGIDPRCWVTIAIVGREQGFDPDNGVYVDVQLMPSGEPEVAYLPSDWVGSNAGSYYPLRQGDVVLCLVVQGDTANGVHVIKRLWSPTDKPPPELADDDDPTEPTQNAILRVEDGATLRIIAKAGARVRFEVDGDGQFEVRATGNASVRIESETSVTVKAPQVLLGDDPGASVARVGDIVTGSIRALGNFGAPILPMPPAAPTASGGVPFVGQIASGANSVRGGS